MMTLADKGKMFWGKTKGDIRVPVNHWDTSQLFGTSVDFGSSHSFSLQVWTAKYILAAPGHRTANELAIRSEKGSPLQTSDSAISLCDNDLDLRLPAFCAAKGRGLVSRPKMGPMATGQNQWYHFGVCAPPNLVYFSGDWDVHWGYDLDFDPWPHQLGLRPRLKGTTGGSVQQRPHPQLAAALKARGTTWWQRPLPAQGGAQQWWDSGLVASLRQENNVYYTHCITCIFLSVFAHACASCLAKIKVRTPFALYPLISLPSHTHTASLPKHPFQVCA